MVSVESCYGHDHGEDFGFRLGDIKVPGLGEVVKIGGESQIMAMSSAYRRILTSSKRGRCWCGVCR
jgi:hypothetical protein